jgi:hypothetical protein
MIERWRELIEEHPHWSPLIQPGLDKLEEYERNLPLTPAYVVAMGMLMCLFCGMTLIYIST